MIMFMKPYITDKAEFITVETKSEGTFSMPVEDYSDDLFGPDDVISTETVTGYGAYLSAPGYMDRTDTSVFDTREDAARHLLEMYFDAPDDEVTDEEERAAIEWLESIANGKEY